MKPSVLITGATRGLGAGMARHFAARGYRIALTGRSVEALQALADELRATAPAVVTRPLDVSDIAAIDGAIRACAAELDGLDIVVVNAGVGFSTPVGQGHLELIRQTIDVNLTGAIATAEAALTCFRERGKGQIVGITSIAGVRGLLHQGAYCASKAGFSRYLESLRCETRDEAITVTELSPGFIDTDLNRAIAKRPFVVSMERGTGIMVDLIERKVAFRYVPPWPWTLVAQFLARASDNAIARM